MNPKVTVVIPTLHGGSDIRRCVESVVASSYPKELIEVIVVGDGCRENVEVAISGLSEQADVKAILQDHSGPAVARNRGINSATGSLIAFTDDDCIVDREWLSKLVACLDSPGVVGVGGRTRSSGESIQASYMDRVSGTDPVLLESGEPWYLVTANCCFRRDAILGVGGFDSSFPLAAAEDVDLSVRLRAKGLGLSFDPTCRVSHRYDCSLASLVRRFHRYGLGTRMLFDKHRIWREWKPDAANHVHALLSGTEPRIREFVEIEEFGLRLWCGLLDRLHHIMYLAGYCQIRSGRDLDLLRMLSTVAANRNGSRLPVEGDRGEILHELGRMLESNVEPDGTQSRESSWVRALFSFVIRRQDFRLWSGFVSALLDLDDLLGLTVYPPSHPASIPDCDLEPDTRMEWMLLRLEQEREYGARCVRVLSELPSGLLDTNFADVEAVCDTYKLNTPRFFGWREAILRRRPDVIDHLRDEERELVEHLLEEFAESRSGGE